MYKIENSALCTRLAPTIMYMIRNKKLVYLFIEKFCQYFVYI